MPRRLGPPARLESLVGRDTLVRGDIAFAGALIVEGRVAGSVRGQEPADLLIVAAHGVVEGPVEVGTARIDGRVDGPVHAAREVLVGARGHVTGAVRAPRVLRAPGGRIDGPVFQPDPADRSGPRLDLPGSGHDSP